MAIIERQNPTTPNLVESDLLYVVTSNNGNRPQFQFVAQVVDKDGNTIYIKQQPNPAGSVPVAAKAVFNISQIARDYMDVDNPWKADLMSLNSSCNNFDIKFWEETGSSVTSSVGMVNPLSGSSVYLLDGVVEMNSGGWNWNSGSYYSDELASENETFSYQHALTHAPLTQSIREDEYLTLSVLNGNFDDFSVGKTELYAQDIHTIICRFYNAARTPQTVFEWPNTVANNGGPRLVSTDLWNTVYTDQTNPTRMLHIGCGPKNLIDSGYTLPADWSYYTVEALAQDDAGLDNSNGKWLFRTFEKQTPECDYEGTRFTWLNELGGWDYNTFPFANSKSDTIDRKTYKQSFVDYSSANTYDVPYDKARRGSSIYAINYDETRVAESDWLVKEQADWLRELIESPNVYIQEGTDFLPVIIQTADYSYKTNPRSQKMYRLTIVYKLANNRRSR